VERLAANGYVASADPDAQVRPEKIIAETALLLLAAGTADCGEDVRKRIDTVARLLIPHARSERMLLGLCLEPMLALDYASAHICISRLGYPDARFDALLRTACDAQAHEGRERPPHRVLEQEWLRAGWSGGEDRRSAIARAARSSVLSRPMDLLGATRDDVYAFTHALMYVTDFNIDARPLPRTRAVILAEAEAALAFALDEQDYDLAGEVLLAWPLTGKTWSAAAVFGFRVLASVEDQVGFLPAPNTRVQRMKELEGDSRADYLFATAYHTAFVMGLLCAAALQPGRLPPARVVRRGHARGSADQILTTLDRDTRDTHWGAELEHLSAPERDALSGFLLTIALRRKVARHDYDGVARLLREGHLLGLTNTPVASQSAELLERLAMFAEATREERSA
jgi:hypothetical protein